MIDRLLGRHKARPHDPSRRYALSTWLFLRALGVIFAIAFVSLWVQIDGLIGRDGILPAGRYLDAAERIAGPDRFRLLPTLCWLDRSDSFLHLLAAAGTVLGISAAAGIVPSACFALLWLLYLSLVVVGRDFLAFQWDALLVETGFVALLLAPLGLRALRARAGEPSAVALWLARWLLFRLMFSSGVVKLASGDPSWRTLSALRFHYETQPLPTWIGWYAHQLPGWFQTASVVAVFAVELVVPFFIFGPRPLRLAAFAVFTVWHAVVGATGNYAFFNLLSVALALLVVDDAAWPSWARGRVEPERSERRWPVWAIAPIAAVVTLLGAIELAGAFRIAPGPRPLAELARAAAPLRIVNGYGLFQVMTTTRPEIVVEGSRDGETWLEYEFRWKPGDLGRRPGFVEPHQPRLDWQMWFAALASCDDTEWFAPFRARLMQGSPAVTALLLRNPFPEGPPRYVRATLYRYRFTDLSDRRRTGAWWRREPIGEFCPTVSLRSDDASPRPGNRR